MGILGIRCAGPVVLALGLAMPPLVADPSEASKGPRPGPALSRLSGTETLSDVGCAYRLKGDSGFEAGALEAGDMLLRLKIDGRLDTLRCPEEAAGPAERFTCSSGRHRATLVSKLLPGGPGNQPGDSLDLLPPDDDGGRESYDVELEIRRIGDGATSRFGLSADCGC